jgi:hypothetical protein
MLSEITSLLSLSAAIPLAAIFILVNIPIFITLLYFFVTLSGALRGGVKTALLF